MKREILVAKVIYKLLSGTSARVLYVLYSILASGLPKSNYLVPSCIRFSGMQVLG